MYIFGVADWSKKENATGHKVFDKYSCTSCTMLL